MDYAAVLKVLVKAEGLAATAAQVTALDKELEKVGGHADAAGGSVKKAGTQVSSFGDDLAKARKATADTSKALDDTGKSADALASKTKALNSTVQAAETGLTKATGSLRNAQQELARTGQVSQGTLRDLKRLSDDGVSGLDKSMAKTRATLSKAQSDIENTGSVSRSTRRDLENLADGGKNAGGGIAGLSSAVEGLGGGFGPLLGSLTAAAPLLLATGGAAFSVAAALAPLAGLAGAAAVGLSAFGQAAGVVALASMGVADAVKEQAGAQDKAAKQGASNAASQRSAADAIRSATEQLANAQDAAKTAQVALNQARTDARRALIDMAAGLETARTSERDAAFGVVDAQKALDALTAGATAQQRVEGVQAVTDALHQQQSAVFALTDAQRQYQTLAAGPDSHAIEEASHAATSAIHQQQGAVLALTDAQQAYQDLIAGPSTEDVGKAQLALSQATNGQTQAQLDLAAAQKAAAGSTDPQKLLALATAQDEVASAAFRVTDAQTALDKINAGPTDSDKAKALLAVGQAQDQVASATDGVKDSTDALAKAQSPASAEDLAKALLAVQQAQDGVADATNGTVDAQSALTKIQTPASAGDIARAILKVREAQDQLTTATRDRERQEKDLNTAQKNGVNGSQQVVAALHAVKQANQQVTDAEHALATAHENAASSATSAAAATAGLNAKFDALPPAAQRFVRALIALKPKLDDLRQTAAAGLFPGVVEGLTKAEGAFEPVKKVVGETARVLGTLATKAGELIGSKAFGKDIETIGGRNALIIGRLGDAAIHVVSAIRNIIVAAGPLTTWLAKVADGWAQSADAATDSARKSGSLSDFFDKTKTVLKTVGSILGNLATAFYNVGRAAAPFGTGTLGSITEVTKKFADWSASVKGQTAIQDFFRKATELAGQFVKAVAAIVATLTTLAVEVMPTFGKILQMIGPHLGAIIAAFIAYKLALTAVTVATNIASVATKAWAAIQWLINDALIATRVELIALAIYTKAAAAAQWLLNIALDANPISLVVIGIAALAAGLVIAYEKVKPFHDAVDALWGVMKDVAAWLADHWALLAITIAGPFGVAAVLLIKHWTTITDDAKAAWNAVKDAITGPISDAISWLHTAFDNVRAWLTARWGEIGTDATTAWDAVKGAITGSIGGAISWVKGAVNDVRAWLGARWGEIGSAAGTAWGGVKDAVTGAVGGAIDEVKKLIGHGGKDASGLIGFLGSAWDSITGAASTFAGTLGDAIGTAFKGVANTVIGFVNDILRAINAIPGIPNIKLIPKISDDASGSTGKAQSNLGKSGHLARGGAFARTGGIVDRPMTFMGEEAPLHPEFVIPTNPAYRPRAKGLLASAAKALGLAEGGTFSFGQIEDIWKKGGGNPAKANTMAWIAEAESHGDAGINYGGGHFSPLGQAGKLASGLWQILGLPFPGDVYDAVTNARMAKAKSGDGTNLHPWDSSRSVWGPHLGSSGGGGILGSIGGAVSGAVSGAVGAVGDILGDIVGKLPGVGDLPDWMKGAGKYVLDKVKDYIGDKVGGLFGGGGSGAAPAGGAHTDPMDGHPVADWIYKILVKARNAHVPFHVESGYRTDAEQLAIYNSGVRPAAVPKALGGPGSNHEGDVFPLGAVDISPGAQALNAWLAASEYASTLIYAGAKDPVHFSHPHGGGYAKGGIWGLLGSYEHGTDYVPQTGPYLLHQGEKVTPAGEHHGPMVNIEGDLVVRKESDVTVLSRQIGWQLATRG